jgi:hypothetical protein
VRGFEEQPLAAIEIERVTNPKILKSKLDFFDIYEPPSRVIKISMIKLYAFMNKENIPLYNQRKS